MLFSQDYFELFDIPRGFEIDLEKLADQYRILQRQLHPDRYVNASDQDRRLSVQKTAFVNEAFQTLKSPLLRARYLLTLKGIEFDDEKETHFDPTFLMEQMELRESLSEIRSDDDASLALIRLMDDILRRKKAMEAELASALNAEGKDQLQEAKQIVQKMQFLVRLQQEAEELEEELLEAY